MPKRRQYGREWKQPKVETRAGNPIVHLYKRTKEIMPSGSGIVLPRRFLPLSPRSVATQPKISLKVPTREFSTGLINPLGDLVFSQLFGYPKMIHLINEKKLPLKDLFETSAQAVTFLTQSSIRDQVKYLDFTGLTLDDVQFKQIVENCPNLTHLILWDSKISKDVLKHLRLVPKLVHLSLSFCTQLDPDSLKYLQYVPNLLELDISGCDQLHSDSLRYLRHVPLLRALIVLNCPLQKDALQHLKFVPALRVLDISLCRELEADTLKHLKHVPELLKLSLTGCGSLESDALKSLVFVPKLRKLLMPGCTQFTPNSLNNLSHVSSLSALSIQDWSQLSSLEFLKHVRHLHSLDMAACTNLKPNALNFLKHVPILISLIMTHCTSLEKEALQKLEFIPGVTHLDITGCKQLSAESIHDLPTKLLALRTLNMALCPQVSQARKEQIKLELQRDSFS
ncbi:MAG: hypothetical protein LLG04_16710 [Parachlamydia sp.]|nr:hypothetical protein [Parachlamydia sp.]